MISRPPNDKTRFEDLIKPVSSVPESLFKGLNVFISPEEAFRLDLRTAENMLLEAVQLDASNAKASQALKQVRELISQLPLII